MPRKRPYNLLCPVARALDVLGDRWALLILRDLHAGPARFQELQTGLRMATNLLTTRLNDLVDSGLVERVERTGGGGYALTDLGRATEPVLFELARFGSQLDRPDDPREPGNLRTIALPLRVLLRRAGRQPDMVVALEIGAETITITSRAGVVDVVHGRAAQPPDVTVATSYEAFLDAGEGILALDELVGQHVDVVAGEDRVDQFWTWMASAFAAGHSSTK